MIPLTRDQETELRRYHHGRPRHPSVRPNSNLIRRNLLMSVRPPGRGAGWYQITDVGMAALRERAAAGRAALEDDR